MWFRRKPHAEAVAVRRGPSAARDLAGASRLTGTAAAAIPLLLIAACSLNDASGDGTYIQLEGSPRLMTYGRVTIQLSDTLGNLQATLYDDTLPSLSRLARLPAEGYQGGPARISIMGYRNGNLAYGETRLYDGRSQRVLSLEITKEDTTHVTLPIESPPSNPVSNPPVTNGPTPTAPKVPGFSALPGDTVVSIRDYVTLDAEASDADGDLAAYAWDCDGDGKADDSASLEGYRMKIPYGRAFAKAGEYSCALRVWDKGGRHSQDTVDVKVELDAPIADAGKDTEVVVGGRILLHAKGSDGFGPIVSRAWKIGSLDFTPVKQQETSITAPSAPGDLMCILMVTDSDSLSTLDTLVVKVLPKPDDAPAASASP
jgi:hypothetical protein